MSLLDKGLVQPWRSHLCVGMRLPTSSLLFPVALPLLRVTDKSGETHSEQGVLSDWSPALFFDSSITGENRRGKRRKREKFQHMSSICNVIYVL